MRLINTSTFEMRDGVDIEAHDAPEYAILSHTWGSDEVTLQQYYQGKRDGEGWVKIQACCELARERDIPYAWVDTVCIDKTNPMELTESIQSMFRWYEGAVVCFAHLGDFEASHDADGPDYSALKHCRYWTRGWTLQELLAPRSVIFFDKDFGVIDSLENLSEAVSAVTGIAESVLERRKSFRSSSVGRRMSWVSRRQTKRGEDIAYCLLGIFDVHMPLFYGEGRRNAFTRLQEHIIAKSDDDSIFAWESLETCSDPETEQYRGILAEDPIEFRNAHRLEFYPASGGRPPYTFSNRGLELPVSLRFNPRRQRELQVLLECHCVDPEDDDTFGRSKYVAIRLRRYGRDGPRHHWARVGPSSLVLIPIVGGWPTYLFKLIPHRRTPRFLQTIPAIITLALMISPLTSLWKKLKYELFTDNYTICVIRSSQEMPRHNYHASRASVPECLRWLPDWVHDGIPVAMLFMLFTQSVVSAHLAFQYSLVLSTDLSSRSGWMLLAWSFLALGWKFSGYSSQYLFCIWLVYGPLIFKTDGEGNRQWLSFGWFFWNLVAFSCMSRPEYRMV